MLQPRRPPGCLADDGDAAWGQREMMHYSGGFGLEFELQNPNRPGLGQACRMI